MNIFNKRPFLIGEIGVNFYDIAKTAFAVVATGETRPYGDIILQKGVF